MWGEGGQLTCLILLVCLYVHLFFQHLRQRNHILMLGVIRFEVVVYCFPPLHALHGNVGGSYFARHRREERASERPPVGDTTM